MAILLSVNLTSCSEDSDDPIKNPEKLVGEWFCIHEKYWGEYDGEKYSEEYSYDINDPEEDCIKWIITEGDGENEFIIEEYFYDGNKWRDDGYIKTILEGNKIIWESDYDDDDIVKDEITYELKGDKLTIKIETVYKNGEYDNTEVIYKKIN